MRKLSIHELNRLSKESFQKKEKIPVVIVMDNIRSMHNVGSVFRTADAFLVEEILLCGITAQPPKPEIHKTALGATETVDWSYHESAAEAVSKLKENGYTIVLIEQTDHSIELIDFEFKNEKYAFVFGNEVKGVSNDVVPLADLAVEIPQFGTKHSFNVSVCAGIVLHAVFQEYRINSQ